MDKPFATIYYKTADGKRIRLDVSIEVKELLEQSDRQIRSQRRQDKRRHTEYIEGLTDTTMVIPQEDFADLVDRMDSYRRLYSAMDKLTETQRRRLFLHYFGGLTYRRIAELENVHHVTIAESVTGARKKLRQHLTD